MVKIFSMEHKYEVISGECLDNPYRCEIKAKIERIINDLHIVTVNVDTYKALTEEETGYLRNISPSFISSYLYSSVSANILIISNLFDNDSQILSLYKLVNCIEQDKIHLETRHYERRENKDIEWKLVHDGRLQGSINKWRKVIEEMRGDIITKIDTLRDKFYAHKDISFSDPEMKNAFSIDEFEKLVISIFEFVNDVSSSIFYEGYAFFNHNRPDVNQLANIVNNYYKYKNDVRRLIYKGIIQKK